MHECRGRHGQALGYAVSPTGADHMHNIWDEGLARSPVSSDNMEMGVYTSVPGTELNPVKVVAYAHRANWRWLSNMIGHCMFVGWTRAQIVELISAITGWTTNVDELMLAGERCVTMARLFNLRSGLGRKDDVLPVRTTMHHVNESPTEQPIATETLDAAVSDFYGVMGWDRQDGVPTKGKLDQLDLAWAAD
jgi:aldehyde:ferredoxin oxidoreductase